MTSLQRMATRSTPALEAWRGFLGAHAVLMARLEQELLDEVGIPLTWYEVLLILSAAPGGRLRMHELAERRLLSRSAATRLVDRMERAGLVLRSQSAGDRRGTYVEMSPEGAAVFRRSAPVHRRGIEQHFASHLDADELALLIDVTDRLSQGQTPPENCI